MTDLFAAKAAEIVKAVEAGASLPEACDRVGVNLGTARGWLRKGRQGVSCYVPFAGAIDSAPAAPQLDSADPLGPLSRVELEQLVAAKARAGSVPAMRLWLDLHRADSAPAQPHADAFSRFDELAQRRQAHA